MLIDVARTQMLLERGQTSRLTGACKAWLASTAGTLWVTIDHDSRDFVLEAGQGIRVNCNEALMISALGGPATLELRPAREPAEAL